MKTSSGMDRTDADSRAPCLRWLRRAPAGIAEERAGRRLGVLSGTFNPPTLAHLALARQAASQLGLAEVLFVLPATPPHKERLEAPLADRAAMLVCAVEGEPTFSAASCTAGLFVEIHQALVTEYPADTRAVFLAGRDAAERILLRWPYADPGQALAEMFARFDVAVAARGGGFTLPAGSAAERYRGQIHGLELPAEFGSVSATRVRERLGRGENVAGVVSDEVAAYIVRHRLYR